MLVLVTLLAATPVQLHYTRAPDAGLCVADQELREAVVRRLGYVPFDDAAEDFARAEVHFGKDVFGQGSTAVASAS